MSGLIKICGIQQASHAVVAAAAGADLLGFNFAASKRAVTPDVARELMRAAKEVNPAIRTVGLFVGASRSEIARTYETAPFDLAQVHGVTDLEDLYDLPVPVVLPVRVEPGGDLERLREFANAALEGPAAFLIFDGYHPTLAGGTGVRADWDAARQFARDMPVMLAGGLTPDNVGEAVASVCPMGVDVAGGVERDGTKDAGLIRAFIESARRAFAQSTSSGTSSQDTP